MRSQIPRDLFAVACVAAVPRALCLWGFAPAWALDSTGYWNCYVQAFERTPVYPLFLWSCGWLCGGSTSPDRMSSAAAETAVWCQHLLSIALCCMLYKTLRNLRLGRWPSLLAAGFFAALAGVALCEQFLLPLSLTLFLLGTASWLFTEGMASGRRWLFIAAGTGFSLAALTRPETVVFLAMFVAAYAIASLANGRQFREWSKQLEPLAIGALPLLLAWIVLFRVNIGYFGMTVLSEYNRSATAYNLFDQVEEQDAKLGQIMCKYYRGPQRKDMICDAWPELVEHMSEMPFDPLPPPYAEASLCRYVGQVSQKLLLRHPGRWIGNAIDSWQQTFVFDQRLGIPPVEHVADPETVDHQSVVRSEALYLWIVPWRQIESWPLLLAYVLSMAYAGQLVYRLCRRRAITAESIFVFAVTCGALGTLAAFCWLAAYFPHYGIPYWSTFVLCAAYGVTPWIASLLPARGADQPHRRTARQLRRPQAAPSVAADLKTR